MNRYLPAFCLVVVFIFFLVGNSVAAAEDTPSDYEAVKKSLESFKKYTERWKDPDFPVLKGPYLGQKPPGSTPKIFAPGIVSTERNEDMYGFFKDGSLFFFESSAPDSKKDWIHIPVYRTEIKNGRWIKPKKSLINRVIFFCISMA